MSRYIDADDLLEITFKNPIGLTAFQNIIKRQPTADVRENVRGEWIFPYEDKKYKRCSACGKTFYSIPATSNYCPNCGADMRGDNNVQRNNS